MPTGKEIADRALIPLNEKWGYIWGKSGQIWTAEAQAKATREMTIKYSAGVLRLIEKSRRTAAAVSC